jgi:hypothetical protein
MMAKDPSDRFQQPIEVVNALAPWTQTPVEPPVIDLPPPVKPRSRMVPMVKPLEFDTQPTQTGTRGPNEPTVGPRRARPTHVGMKMPTTPGMDWSRTDDVRWISDTLTAPPPQALASPASGPRPVGESRLGQVGLILGTVLLSIGAGLAVCWLIATLWF